MVMIQYYTDLIATVTYNEVVAWLAKNQYKYNLSRHKEWSPSYIMAEFHLKTKEDTIALWAVPIFSTKSFNPEPILYLKDEAVRNKLFFFFESISQDLNKPIDHIVHEMKNVQQPDISNANIGDNSISITIERLMAIPIEKWEFACKKRDIEFEKIEGHINLNKGCFNYVKCSLCVEYNDRCIHCKEEHLNPNNIKVIAYNMLGDSFLLKFIDTPHKDDLEMLREEGGNSIELENGGNEYFCFNRHIDPKVDIVANENGIQCSSPNFWMCILGGFFEWFPLDDFYNNVKGLITELESM